MSLAERRRQLIDNLTTKLTQEGWSECDLASLPEAVRNALEWSPDKQFSKPQGEVILLEVEDELDIPSWLTRTLKTNLNALQNVRILVASARDAPVDFENVKTATENSIYFYVGHRRPLTVHDPSEPYVSKAPKTMMDTAKQRFRMHKRIPSALTESLNNVENLAYYKELRIFAETYENQTFDSWDEEHDFVHKFLIDHLANKLRTSQLLEQLNVLSLLDEISDVVAGKRPHFLHSFQTFLLGSAIVDSNYELFNRIYNNCFNPQIDTRIDLPWLLTSLLHDVACPFENLDKLGQVGRMLEFSLKGFYPIYVPHFLGSWYNQMCLGPMDPEWEPQIGVTGDPLCKVLSQNKYDHGIMGAISLMASAEGADKNTLNTTVLPAAFSIAIHNSKIWPIITENCGFPISSTSFPLTFLLLACDNLEEWGRERLKDRCEGNDPKALIIGKNFTQPIGNFDIWLDEIAAATMLRNRFDWINSKLFRLEGLRIGCSYFID
jgi:hypothetical protein